MNEQEAIDFSVIEGIRRFGTDHPNRYNTIWRRFCAGTIDSLLFLALLFPIHSLVYDKWLESNILIVYVWECISEFIFYGYIVYMHGKYGKTLGKSLMGLKIIDQSEQKEVGYKQALFREIVPIAIVAIICISNWITFLDGEFENNNFTEAIVDGLFTVWLIAEIGTAALNKKRRAIHDYMARTVVIKL